ncbi:hypothetical protein DMENIID0001_135850 [Sergentomyia squamirostris]
MMQIATSSGYTAKTAKYIQYPTNTSSERPVKHPDKEKSSTSAGGPSRSSTRSTDKPVVYTEAKFKALVRRLGLSEEKAQLMKSVFAEHNFLAPKFK